MSTAYEYDVFLSHSSRDKAWVERLATDLEAERIGDRSVKVFLDKWDIPYGASIMSRLDSALKRSHFIAVIMTPEMLTSQWGEAEWASQLHQDPTNRLGRILPVRLRDLSIDNQNVIDVPAFLQTLKYFDFRHDGDYSREFERFVIHVRGEPLPRGRLRRDVSPHIRPDLAGAEPTTRVEPDKEPETLLSNAMAVTNASPVWVGKTALSRPLTAQDPSSVPPAVIHGGLFSFRDPCTDGNPYQEFLSGTVTPTPLELLAAEPTTRPQVVELLNLELTRYLSTFAIAFDRSHERFFVERTGDRSRMVRTGSGRTRTILRAPDEGSGGFWVHQAARLTFTFLNSQFVLLIEPTLHFTSDGRKHAPREMLPRLHARWRARNRTILGYILLWSDLLTQGQRRAWIPEAGVGIELRRLPLLIRTDRSVVRNQMEIKIVREFVLVETEASSKVAFAFVDDAATGQIEDDEDIL